VITHIFGGWTRLSWKGETQIAFSAREKPGSPHAIFVVDIATGEKTKLTEPPNVSEGDAAPAWSPDGHSLAFLRASGAQQRDVYLLRVGGSGKSADPTRLTFDNRPVFRSLAWSSDGRSILFSSNRAGRLQLFRMSLTDSKMENIPVGTENVIDLTMDSRQKRLAFATAASDSNIWRVDIPPRGQNRLGDLVRLIGSTRAETTPQYSPDGKWMAFTSTESGSPEIWISDSDGREAMPITSFGVPLLGSPRWSADSANIAFDSTKDGTSDIYVISATGGQPRRITHESSEDVRPSWSGDGRWIYFGSDRSGDWQIWKQPLGGGPAVRATRNGGDEAFESMDRRWLYYTRRRVPGLWKIGLNGEEERPVLPIRFSTGGGRYHGTEFTSSRKMNGSR
jgi:Tol biopolymer transport system component